MYIPCILSRVVCTCVHINTTLYALTGKRRWTCCLLPECPSNIIWPLYCMYVVIVIVLYSTGEGGSYDATEERQKQIIRDRLRANAVCMYVCVSMFVYIYV